MRPYRLATLIALALIGTAAHAAPWTYRGSLTDGGQPANGTYDIRLTLLDANGKRAVVGPVTFADVKVDNGSFALDVDFGADLSNASAMKLKTEVGEHGANFVALGEPSTFDAKATLAGVCWDTQGNAGTSAATDFIGTTDNQALKLRANNLRVGEFTARGLPADYGDAPSVALGSAANAASATGATISGGGSTRDGGGNSCPECANKAQGIFSTVSGGNSNFASGDYSNIGGGTSNTSSGSASAVLAGIDNVASGTYSTIAGGALNEAKSENSFVGGGLGGKANGYSSVSAGGLNNWTDASNGMVLGGVQNCAGGTSSFAGGSRAKVRSASTLQAPLCLPVSGDSNGDEGSFVWADSSVNADFASTGPNQVAIRAVGGLRWGGTGVGSTTSPAYIHQVNTSNNTCDGGSAVANSRTVLDHPLLNGNPNAVITITPNFGLRSAGVSPPNAPLGLYYSDIVNGSCAGNGRWIVYQLTGSPAALSNGARFNVWFVLP